MIGVQRRGVQPVVIAALSACLVAGLGALNTTLGAWYYNLHKPSWQPPDWLFGPVWTLIFAMAAIAGITHWRNEPNRNARLQVVAAFGLNAFLNLLWSLLFFRLQRPDWAMDEVGLLWFSILLLIILVRRASRGAAWLLLPYLAWVSFASLLNWKIVTLNFMAGSHG